MVAHREHLGDVRSVIGLVELWSAEGEPTPAARLGYARALIALRLMDRAWVALRELADIPEIAAEAHRQTARMFLLRGWPKRARTSLQKALAEHPKDPELNDLWEASGRPAPELSSTPPTDPEEALAQAEMRLGRGEVLRGQALLEGILRDDPECARARDLLWGLEGDFSMGGTLAEVVEQLAPTMQDLVDLGDEGEFSDSLTTQGDDEPEDASQDPRFPSLFREASDPDTEDYDEGETTQTRLMASTLDLVPEPNTTQPQDSEPVGGDTQILRVIEHGKVEPASGLAHRDVAVPDEHFDLDAYRREMGVLEDLLPRPGADLEPLETEDNDVIVFTRLESPETSLGLEPDPSEDTMSHPDAVRFLSEEARESADKEFEARTRALAARAAVANEVTAKLDPPSGDTETRPRRARRDPDFMSRHAGLFLALILALLIAIFVLVFAIGLRIFQT